MKRLGIILPSSNTTVENEFSMALHGSDISLHSARIPLKDVTLEGLEAMEKEIEKAALLLKDAEVNLVVFACTSGSLFRGLGYDVLLAKQISEVAKVPAVTTSGAVVDALKKLGVRRLGLATPYINEINTREIDFLSKSGFEVVTIQSLNIRDNLKIGRLTLNDALTLTRNANSKLADAIFISCTNFRTFEAIPLLEEQLEKPVISSNSATLRAALKALEIKTQTKIGKIFDAKKIIAEH